MRAILNPLDLDAVRKEAEQEVNHPWFDDLVPVVVGVGRLTPRKGNHILVEAFARARREVEARLLIVADGPERERVETMARDLGVADDVEILGYQENPFKYVRRSAVFVSPSVAEGFAYVVAEAMAVGTPVVAAECAGPAEVLAYGKCGLLAPPGDSAELAERMVRLLGSRGLRRRLAALAERRVEDFDVARITRRYEEELAGCA
jgi:glycosyltransferase involved in cell wall biosynthesis